VTSISDTNQITIPSDVLREAGICQGDVVGVFCRGPGRIELIRVNTLIDEYAGSLGTDVYPPGYLDDVRNH
jgi:bifunctional DNA-binding transcriptional regulator/antitoxin component of YhaV-PrlF toxin-antitoxin module